MKRFKQFTGPYFSITVFFILILVILSVSRLALLGLYHSRVDGINVILKSLVNGVRIDIVMAVYCVSVPVLLAPFMEGYRWSGTFFRHFIIGWFTLWSVVFVVMEAITPTYISAYDVRPNRLFVEYLIYPKELGGMLLKGYLLSVIMGVFALFIAAYASFRLSRSLTRHPSNWHPVTKLAVLPPLALLLFLGARSSLGHRPINPSTVAFSNDALINDLTLNSSYSLLYAIYRMKDEGRAAKIYGNMDKDKMISLVRQTMDFPSADFTNEKIPTLHFQKAGFQRTDPLNLVIVLEESLGAEFIASLGGLPLTPNIEKLSEQGLWFDRLYATGTRSVRGIEAVICGFLPTPGRSVVKLGKSQQNFFTLARLLSERGYDTRFIYGGDSNFDNMKKFFLNNGFQQVIDEKDFSKDAFHGSWGVSDQDLFEKSFDIINKDTGRPSFTLIFSSTNHPPYEFPDNVIDLYEQPKPTVHNAVKYADYALGKFFEKAKTSSWWDKTVFLVVADHNAHTGGESLMSIDKFRIPGLIIGPGVSPHVYQDVASQIDLPPTLLSIMGISCETPMIGRDLSRPNPNRAGRAILQFYTNQAYISGDFVTLLQPGERIDQFIFKDHQLIPADSDNTLSEIALAHALWASWAYKNMAYRTDTGPALISQSVNRPF